MTETISNQTCCKCQSCGEITNHASAPHFKAVVAERDALAEQVRELQGNPIQAVITYTDNGTRRPCGQTVGADGRGTYAVIVHAQTPEEAEELARSHIKKIENYEYRGRITNIVLVVNYPGFCSDAFQYLP